MRQLLPILLLAIATPALAGAPEDTERMPVYVGVSAVQPVVTGVRNATLSAEPMAIALDVRLDVTAHFFLGGSLYAGTGGDQLTATSETEVTRGAILRLGLHRQLASRLGIYGWVGIGNYFEVETRPYGGLTSKGKGFSLAPWGVGLTMPLGDRLHLDAGWSALYANGMEAGGGTAIGGDIDIRGPHAGLAWAWH